MKRSIWLMPLFIFSSCAHYYYQGSITAADSEGSDRLMTLYWNTTDPLIGKLKTGQATLLTQCGSTLTFNERPEGIVFRGDPTNDELLSTEVIPPSGAVCGEFIGVTSFADFDADWVDIAVYCTAKNEDDFSLQPRRYLTPDNSPHRFEIEVTKQRSFAGEIPNAPEPLQCDEF